MMVHARGAISGLPSKSILITDLSIKRLIFNVIVILLIGKLYIYACLKVWHKNIDFYNNVLTVFCNKSFFFATIKIHETLHQIDGHFFVTPEFFFPAIKNLRNTT